MQEQDQEQKRRRRPCENCGDACYVKIDATPLCRECRRSLKPVDEYMHESVGKRLADGFRLMAGR